MAASIPAAGPAPGTGTAARRRERVADGNAKYVFLLPALAYLLLLGIFPLLFSLYLVFASWNAGQGIRWVGLANLQRLAADERFWGSLQTTLFFVAVVAFVELFLGFLVALALQHVTRGKNLLRGLLALPMLLTPIAVSFTWKMLFDYNRGPLNFFLDGLGLERVQWLAGQTSAILSLALVDIWQWTPFIIVAALAALESLPTELYEAATVDGASPLQLLLQITLPLVQPYLVAIVLLRAIDAFKVFDTIYILTGGGPGTATEMLTFYAYVAGFRPFNMGFTSTVSWALVIIMTVLFTVYLRVFRRIDDDQAAAEGRA
jgi:multiple sugar transport system permease protein